MLTHHAGGFTALEWNSHVQHGTPAVREDVLIDCVWHGPRAPELSHFPCQQEEWCSCTPAWAAEPRDIPIFNKSIKAEFSDYSHSRDLVMLSVFPVPGQNKCWDMADSPWHHSLGYQGSEIPREQSLGGQDHRNWDSLHSRVSDFKKENANCDSYPTHQEFSSFFRQICIPPRTRAAQPWAAPRAGCDGSAQPSPHGFTSHCIIPALFLDNRQGMSECGSIAIRFIGRNSKACSYNV